jgi:phosphoribosylaminoimidazole-succinocarboxamide synthase
MMATLKTIDLEGYGKKYQGKVRDFYKIDGKRILITTDRISSFDRILGLILHKGQVLNQLSEFWFKQTKEIVANHLLAVPDPNVMIVKDCQPYSIEMVVRGYITGVTITSLWYNYDLGKREIYGLKFPDGLTKNQKLPQPVITPTTRGTGPGGHDEKISKAEILKRKIVPRNIYEQMEKAVLALFKKGTEVSQKAGLILVDTKYEFGDWQGQLTLIDEVHTADSSRYWIAKTYQERIKKGLEPENFDKEFFRFWYAKRGYRGDGKIPRMPDSYRRKVSQRYVQLYEKLTGKKFKPGERPIKKRIIKNLKKYFHV